MSLMTPKAVIVYENKSSHLFEWLKKVDKDLLSWPANQITSM